METTILGLHVRNMHGIADLVEHETQGNKIIHMLDICPVDEDTIKPGTEDGIIGSIWNFICTVVSTVTNFITGTVNWISKRIASLVSIRKAQKKLRDKKYKTLTDLYGAMSNDQREAADKRFASYKLEHLPSHEAYIGMCDAFAHFTKKLNVQLNIYITQDVAIFGQEIENSETIPSWVRAMFDDANTRECFNRFGIFFEEKNFIYKSPFVNLPSMTLGNLGYTTIDHVAGVNRAYGSQCWAQLPSIQNLKEKMETCSATIKRKKSEMRSDLAKVDKKEIVKSAKFVMVTATLVGRLVAYLLTIDESLDVRRGWLLDAAIRACSVGNTEKQ